MNETTNASDHGKPVQEMDWDVARRFHGHLGPWLMLGVKIGRRAIEDLKADRHFGVKVAVVCPLAPPPSCLIDGLQWSTGATYGKRNIAATAGERVNVKVTNTRTGSSVTFHLLVDVPESISQWLQNLGDEKASVKLWECPDSDLFVASPIEPGNNNNGS